MFVNIKLQILNNAAQEFKRPVRIISLCQIFEKIQKLTLLGFDNQGPKSSDSDTRQVKADL